METQDLILNNFARIIIQTTYALDGKVIEITPTHHVIKTSQGKVIEVKNENVLKVETRASERVDSDVP